jgi:hypothetical protein
VPIFQYLKVGSASEKRKKDKKRKKEEWTKDRENAPVEDAHFEFERE